MILPEVIKSVVINRCPRCHTGKMFVTDLPYDFKQGLTMNKSCSHCELNYEPEPGYYYGAMYVSYALTVGYGVIAALFCFLIWGGLDWGYIIFVVSSFVLLFPVIFRWSRTLWLNFFVRYKPAYKLSPNRQG